MVLRPPGPAQVRLGQMPDVVCQHRELWMSNRTVIEEPIETVARTEEDVARAYRGRLARALGCQIARAALQKPSQRLWRHEPAVEQRADACPQPPLAELCEHQRHIVVVGRHRTANPKRLIERIADEARHVGFGSEIEAGIDVGFEWKLTQQREAERID